MAYKIWKFHWRRVYTKKFIIILLLVVQLLAAGGVNAEDGRQLVKDAIEYWRGTTSYAEATMTVHRPEWERSFTLQSWIKGRSNTVVRFTAPPKDAGNASLSKSGEMWSYSPNFNV